MLTGELAMSRVHLTILAVVDDCVTISGARVQHEVPTVARLISRTVKARGGFIVAADFKATSHSHDLIVATDCLLNCRVHQCLMGQL